MAKQLSLEQARTFFKNLATALLPGSKFALWVKSTSQRNKFTAVILPSNYNPKNVLSVAKPMPLVIDPSFDNVLTISGLDSFLKASNPYLMLRPNQAIELDWLAETLKLDSIALYQVVLRSIQKKANNAIKNAWDNKTKSFYIRVCDKVKNYKEDTDIMSPKFKTMEELYVWADLNAN